MSLRKLTVAALWAATVAAAQQPFDLDVSFRTTLASEGVGSILELPDGKIYISGRFKYPGELNDRYLTRLLPDGTWDSSYPNTYPNGYGGGKITPWQNGYFFIDAGGTPRRILPNGAVDESYDPNTNTNFTILQGGDYHLYPDGRVLITGYVHVSDSVSGFVGWYSLVWLTSEGHLDTSRIHRQSAGPVYKFNELPTGKFICAGGGGIVQGRPVSTVFQVEADGALDTTFNAPFLDYGEAVCYYPQSNGKVVVGGRFHFVGSPDTLSLVRLLPDGQFDPTFNNQLMFKSTYHHLATPSVRGIQPIGTGKLAISGSFDQIDGETCGGIAMIDTAGNLLDGYFNGSGCGAYNYGSIPQQYPFKFIVGITPSIDSSSYYIYGAYHGYDDGTTIDTLQRLVTRLYGLNVGIYEQENTVLQPLSIVPNPSTANTHFSLPAPVQKGTLTIHDTSGRSVWQAVWPQASSSFMLPAGVLAPGTYLVRVREGSVVKASGKLIVLP